MTSATHAGREIYSSFGGDSELAQLVALFVQEMPARTAALQQAFASGDLEAVRRAAHQLKGAAGSHGFDSLTSCAAGLESAILNGEPTECVGRALQELLHLCDHIRPGVPE